MPHSTTLSMSSNGSSVATSCSLPLLGEEEEALIDRLERRRLAETETEYAGYCAAVCRTGRLQHYGRLRALVWRDAVFGRRRTPAVPQLSDSIIRQLQEETRAQAGQHSRENTQLNDSFDSFTSPTAKRDDSADDRDEVAAEGGTAAPGPSPAAATVASPTSAAADTTTPPVLSASAIAARRHRHRSTEPARRAPPVVSPPSSVDGGGGGGEDGTPEGRPLVFAPLRRRAVSQLSRRVKSDAAHILELAKDVVDRGAAPTQDLSGSVLRPMLWYHLPDNCQPRVVEADIERSLWSLYPETAERGERRLQLKNMILRILLHNPERFYYQGLHELMGFVMYMLSPHLDGEEIVSVCEGLLNTRWRRFSAPQLKNSEAMLYAMHAAIAQEDPPLAAALEWCGVGPESHYAVSWMITWYVHSVKSVDVLTRLFDFFVADEDGSAVVYFTAALVMSQRETVFEWIGAAKAELGVGADLTEGSDDGIVLMARIYAQLSRLPVNVLDTIDADALHTLLTQAAQFRTLYHPTVQEEEQNFLGGEVKKLGLLSNQRTRNAALRLLWHFLPREWRSPAKAERMRRMMLWTSVVAVAAALVVGTAAADAKTGWWMHGLLHP